jgi:phage repressor protein C with HTH and peptisase S24 domain
MEPKIQDGDLVLIKQQDAYEPNEYVFIIHNDLPKLKKIVKQDDKRMLESVNRFFDKVEISKFDESKVIGVVKKVIKNF